MPNEGNRRNGGYYMIGYGYIIGGKKETHDILRELSVVCTKHELNELIEFLQDVKEEVSGIKNAEGEHWHFRDWNEGWSEKQSDFIIFLTDCKKEL